MKKHNLRWEFGMKITKAVIPAAGMGTRFYPLTRAQPKEMLPILDKPIIHYVVEEAVNSGIDEILIIVGYGKDAIIDYFDSNPMDEIFQNSDITDLPYIYFVRQKKQVGLSDSIRYAEKFVGSDPFVVLLGDTIYSSSSNVPVTAQLVTAYDKWKSTIVAVEKVEKNKVQDYGIIEADSIDESTWNIKGMVEKPNPESAPSNLGITGTYILTESIFDEIGKLKPGKNGEYQLTDALSGLCTHEQVIGKSFEGTRFDIGTKELWIKAFFEFASKDERFKNLLH